ncbi:MAG: hypothetical protein MPK31_08720, partial [Gammaproteobacteria bacterium]|nr:hypothetical protein [Gammaproteobacteria bacterium]
MFGDNIIIRRFGRGNVGREFVGAAARLPGLAGCIGCARGGGLIGLVVLRSIGGGFGLRGGFRRRFFLLRARRLGQIALHIAGRLRIDCCIGIFTVGTVG